MKNNPTYKMAISALLCAIGIAIPMFSPFKIPLPPPASLTVGSHVAIFIAMFISPVMATGVSLVTALGFFLGGFHPVIVLRAATHVVFALIGAIILKKKPATINSFAKSQMFSFCIGLLHALCEVTVVSVFFFGNNLVEVYYTKGYLVSVVLLIGAVALVHSMIDFTIALYLWKILGKNK